MYTYMYTQVHTHMREHAQTHGCLHSTPKKALLKELGTDGFSLKKDEGEKRYRGQGVCGDFGLDLVLLWECPVLWAVL